MHVKDSNISEKHLVLFLFIELNPIHYGHTFCQFEQINIELTPKTFVVLSVSQINNLFNKAFSGKRKISEPHPQREEDFSTELCQSQKDWKGIERTKGTIVAAGFFFLLQSLSDLSLCPYQKTQKVALVSSKTLGNRTLHASPFSWKNGILCFFISQIVIEQ